MFNILERNKVFAGLSSAYFLLDFIIYFNNFTFSVYSLRYGVNDKLEHMLAYFGLSFLLYLTLLFQKKSIMLKKYAMLFTLLIVVFYGALDEVHQLLIPGRSCELLDFSADMLGGILGIVLLKILIRVYKFQESATQHKSN
ncbi:MAG: VanZ family protein [Ignavibacteriales bacterium]|nr:VanZ family protein [Ignavibacteriales bacterium]